MIFDYTITTNSSSSHQTHASLLLRHSIFFFSIPPFNPQPPWHHHHNHQTDFSNPPQTHTNTDEPTHKPTSLTTSNPHHKPNKPPTTPMPFVLLPKKQGVTCLLPYDRLPIDDVQIKACSYAHEPKPKKERRPKR